MMRREYIHTFTNEYEKLGCEVNANAFVLEYKNQMIKKTRWSLVYYNFMGEDDNMNYTFKENQLDYETYYILRKSVKWNNWSREQAEIALVNSYYTVTVFDNKVPIGMGSCR